MMSTPTLRLSKVQVLCFSLCNLQFVEDAFLDHHEIADKNASVQRIRMKLECTVESETSKITVKFLQFLGNAQERVSSGQKCSLLGGYTVPSTVAKEKLAYSLRAFG